MKKLLTLVVVAISIALSSCKYDDDDLWSSVHGLEDRVAKLEELCKQMNTNIVSLQAIVNVLQESDYITGVAPVMQGGKEVGYIITFSKSNPITIYHGKDGQDGEDGTDGNDGTTPSIGVKQDTDGIYYWTLNGEWLTDDQGEKIKAEGVDGNDGTDGDDGVTPKFKIENEYWYISYNNGESWEQLGKATGGESTGGDSMFTDIDYKTSTDYVIFTLADGTQIKLPTWSAFEALQRLCNETNTNLSSLQAIVTALQNNDYITSVDPLTENGKVVGYTIKFAKSNPIVIYNGKDGADGNTPVIGIKKDTDGIYYWTLDGEFILVDGHKIQAQGDGNGTTPKLEIRNGYWWVSYDDGQNWEQLGKATGEDGKDGESIKITQDENNVYFELEDGTVITMDENNVYFELEDGTVITIPKSEQSGGTNIIQFEDENVKNLCVATWDTDGDGELSYDEAAAVTTLGTVFKGNTEIQSFNELRYFTGLTVLDANAFYDNSNLCKIALPDGITTIEDQAFFRCSSLKDIAIPNSVTKIGDSAFDNCNSLVDIALPEGIVTIGDSAFWNCTSLRSITLPQNIITIGNNAFSYCSSLTSFFGKYASSDHRCLIIDGQLIAFARSGLTEYVIPNDVTTIGDHAFAGCYDLTNIIFSNSITTIGEWAFVNCTSLTNITLPNSITVIKKGAFSDCCSLKDIIIPNRVTTIDVAVFANCSDLASITFPDRVTSIGNRAFDRCSSLTNITIPEGVTSIGVNAFIHCECLENITIPEGVNTIGGSAFAYCESLRSIVIPKSVTTIDRGAFAYCRRLTDIYCKPTTPPTLGQEVFSSAYVPSIFVPQTSVGAYKAASSWKAYVQQIVGYDFTK